MPSASATNPSALASESRVVARWIFGLRWTVFVLLLATLPVVQHVMGFAVSYPVALAASGVAPGKAPLPRRGSGSPRRLAAFVALDLVAMAVVLGASGGAANPLSAVFFVHVALAASLLPPRYAF